MFLARHPLYWKCWNRASELHKWPYRDGFGVVVVLIFLTIERVAFRIMHVLPLRKNKQQKKERWEQEAAEHPVS